MSVDMDSKQHAIVIDPSYEVFNKNKLFDLTDPVLNRDGQLMPFHRLHSGLAEQGIAINTADLLFEGKVGADIKHYYSLGILKNIEQLKSRRDVSLKGFLIMEPPVIAPELYKALPSLTADFEHVYVHNTIGDGYSLQGVDQSKLRKLYVPQPYKGVLEQFWTKAGRLNRVVVINGNHKPISRTGELYSKRIEAMAALARLNAVDLYGSGWEKWWARRSWWLPYWLNRSALMSISQGACASKYETLSRYRFCLCFENTQMAGYVTEKIFDCLYAGTIPLYLGAPDIDSLIPSAAYIDCRKFVSWDEMWHELNGMSENKVNAIREAGRAFLGSEEYLKYYNSLPEIMR
ncbi:MAG: hypothetical protein A3J24_06525 [Deltaproteobacteria bacterium RIFCSPLOWO2_02_FULL_53_8]|nr:MAG: hypothetical protein A3J24_06525 [Deltaproteobacteria bacterium RIFCSPLOWO2_02_FULL_53_8]